MSAQQGRKKPIFSLTTYGRGIAAFIANRTEIPFPACRDIVAWHWPLVVEAYDEGARFQEAGSRIMATGALSAPASLSLIIRP
ncbi:MAG: hypothetical protein ACE5KF_11240 [Kiloniellaceae bacterium]